MLIQAYVQMILAHVFAQKCQWLIKSTVGSDDLIYNAVEYVAKNFREKISLEKNGIRFVCKQICVIKNVCKNLSL